MKNRTPEGYTILRRVSAYTMPFQPSPHSTVRAWEIQYCKSRGINPHYALKGQHR